MIIFVISLQIRGWFIPSGFPRPGGKRHQRGGIQGGSLRGSPRLSSSNTPIVDRFWLGITISSWEAQFFLGLKKEYKMDQIISRTLLIKCCNQTAPNCIKMYHNGSKFNKLDHYLSIWVGNGLILVSVSTSFKEYFVYSGALYSSITTFLIVACSAATCWLSWCQMYNAWNK